MSIQTELTRISDGVSDALVALEEKGVTIPDGIKVDGLADLIAAIESGGGNLNGVWGLFTPANTSLVTIDHGLGKRPVVWGVIATALDDKAQKSTLGHFTYVRNGTSTGEYSNSATSFSGTAKNEHIYGMHGFNSKTYWDTENSDDISEPNWYNSNIYVNKNYLKILPSTSRNQTYCTVGDTYVWFVLGAD
jgi:hypothetical protein